MAKLIRKLAIRIRNGAHALRTRLKKGRIARHVAALALARQHFKAYPNVAAVFQTFNKGHMLPDVLGPFLRKDFQNIILFADGCCDDTLGAASRRLLGKNHIVLGTSNLHEITTYSLASLLAPQLGGEFLLLCQDDDIYPEDFSWLDAALSLMRADPAIATIGFNGGFDFVAPIADSDENFATAAYQSKTSDGRPAAELAPYFAITGKKLEFRRDGFPYDYVDLIDRAPQLVRLSFLREIGGMPLNYAPYNYDDIFLSMAAWRRGQAVVHMPIEIARNVGIGGMRLFQALTLSRRPEHLGRNWHQLYAEFGDFINGGELRRRVDKLRRERLSVP